MTTDPCAEMHLLVQADADGELAPADAARVAAHLEGCPACASLQAQLIHLSRRIRQEASSYSAPAALRPRRSRLRKTAAPFGAALALAAAILLAVLPRDRLPDELTADHVRALQPGHLLDVVSTDRHTVKPWFAGKLDFAPKVVDLSEQGFPLQGGRLDFVAGRPVAVLIYKRREHIIDVYIWPATTADTAGTTHNHGFNLVRWQQDELAFSAISDLDPKELADFTTRLKTAS